MGGGRDSPEKDYVLSVSAVKYSGPSPFPRGMQPKTNPLPKILIVQNSILCFPVYTNLLWSVIYKLGK